MGVGRPRLIRPEVVASRRIAARAFERHYRAKYRRLFAKVAYFVRHEGIFATYRKSRSKVVERRIESEIAIIVAHVRVAGRDLIGVTRALGERTPFHTGLIYEPKDGLDLDRVVLDEAALEALEAYLPIPSCPAPERLSGLILEQNPQLTRVDPETLSGAGTCSVEVATHETGDRQVAPGSEGGRMAGKAGLASRPSAAVRSGRPGVYFLGFGSYIREQVLAHFRRDAVLALDYKASIIARHQRAGIPLTDQFEEVLDRIAVDPDPLVIVSSYHSDHAPMARSVLEANPAARVFVEKPPAVTLEEAESLVALREAGAWIDVGFNRRYAPMTTQVRRALEGVDRPLIMTAVVKELKLPPTHWYFWPNQGTRVTGNVCHWLDLAVHLVGRPAHEVSLQSSGDTVSIGVAFEDGSLATVVATDRGDDLPGVTESIEVRAAETTVILDDYRVLRLREDGRAKTIRRLRRDKGHAAMYRDLRQRWRTGAGPRYPLEDLLQVPRLTEVAAEMLVTGERVQRLGTGGSS